MVQKQAVVKNSIGLHARPAAQLVELCKGFKCTVKLESGTKTCDAKSIFGVLHCCIKVGETVTVKTEGEDEALAADEIVRLIEALED